MRRARRVQGPAVGRNATYSLSHRFVWMRLAKNGTRSLLQLLEALVPDLRSTDTTRGPSDDLERLLRSEPLTFAIVRDPWDRLASAWQDKIAMPPRRDRPQRGQVQRARRMAALGATDAPLQDRISTSFPDFVRMLPGSRLYEQDRHFMPQTKVLGAVDPTVVGRFERFEIDVNRILETIGIEMAGVTLPHRNRRARTRRDMSRWYDDRAWAIVADLYVDDVHRWYPHIRTRTPGMDRDRPPGPQR